MKKQYYISWWNLENLFDSYNSPHRPAWLQQKLNSELQGWDEDVLIRKIQNLAAIIRKMNNAHGPDILGVSEVENLNVLQMLALNIEIPGRTYKIAHMDSPDERGVDIAFIYDANLFGVEGVYNYEVRKRFATRDILQVNFVTSQGHPFILIGNHWNSRISGKFETEAYRIIAAETLSYWLERIVEIRGKDVPILVMGDFNDEPFDRAMTDYALSTNSRTKVLNARNPRLFNLMFPFLGRGLGTFYYGNFPFVFDQMMVTKSMLKSSALIAPKQVSPGMYQVQIVMIPEMVTGGDYPTAKCFGRPSKKSTYDPMGYSDHFPVSIVVEEK